jgi:type II secretory pathway predicted ATPase ExeA
MKALLEKINKSQNDLARYCGASSATISLVITRDQWPRRKPETYREKIREFFFLFGCTEAEIAEALVFKDTAAKDAAGQIPLQRLKPKAKSSANPSPNPNPMEELMLLQNETLTQDARKHFRLPRNPFAEDLASVEDVFLSPDIRFCRETMWDVARNGGFCALVGESGSGKSTLREEMFERIKRENAHVIVAEPYILAMEVNDEKGKTLKSSQIAEAMIRAIDPSETPKNNPQARFDQLHKLLISSRQAGNTHLLLIEEAHCLPTATLKHLKRFRELKDGFTRLLGILLVGQPELKIKLSAHNPEVREVAQRCEIVELEPLDRNLEGYVAHKLARVGAKVGDIFEDDTFDAIRATLTRNVRGSRADARSICYPLVVNNLIARAMNNAARISMPKVNADLIHEAV